MMEKDAEMEGDGEDGAVGGEEEDGRVWSDDTVGSFRQDRVSCTPRKSTQGNNLTVIILCLTLMSLL